VLQHRQHRGLVGGIHEAGNGRFCVFARGLVVGFVCLRRYLVVFDELGQLAARLALLCAALCALGGQLS